MNLLQIGKSIEEKYEERKKILDDYQNIDQDITLANMLLTTGIEGKTSGKYTCYSEKLLYFENLFEENELLILTPAHNHSFVKKYLFNIDNNYLLLISLNDIKQIVPISSSLNKNLSLSSILVPIENSYATISKLPYYSIMDLSFSGKDWDSKCKAKRTDLEDGEYYLKDILVPLSLEQYNIKLSSSYSPSPHT